jgi:hypothetical protein
LLDFINDNDLEDSGYRLRLYRLIRQGPKPRRALIEEWHNETVELTYIGESHGSGEYELHLNFTDANGERSFRSKHFWLDEHWDKVRQANGPALTAMLPPAEVVKPMDQMKELIALVTAAAASVAPLLTRRESDTNPAEHFRAMSEMTTKLLSDNFANMLSMQNQVLQAVGQGGTEEEEEQVEEPDVVTKLIGGLAELLPVLKSLPEQAKQAAAEKARENPNVKAVAQNSTAKRQMVDSLISRFGLDDAGEIIRLMRFRVPKAWMVLRQEGEEKRDPSEVVA